MRLVPDDMTQSSSEVPFSIEIDRGAGADRILRLRYEEPGYKLELHFDLTGFGVPYDWVGADSAFDAWSLPAGVPISEARRREIRQRVEAPAIANRLRIGFEPPMTPEQITEQMRAAGWVDHIRPDGAVEWKPPRRRSILLPWLRKFFGT